MLKYFFKNEENKPQIELDEPCNGAWVNGENLVDEDINEIAQLTGLDLHDLEDILDPFELPRLERQEGNLILFVRNPAPARALKDRAGRLHTESLTIILSDKYFLTLSADKNSVAQKMISQNFAIMTNQKSKLLLYILLQVSQMFTAEIRQARRGVLMQQKSFKRVVESDIMALVKTEEVLNQYLSALLPMQRVFENLVNEKIIKLYEDDVDLLQDSIISIRQSVDLCETSVKSIQSLRDSYQIIFTNRLNVTIQTLTILTILLTIPTVIGSLFGMNVTLPLSSNPLAFWYICGIAIILMWIFVWYYRKKLSRRF